MSRTMMLAVAAALCVPTSATQAQCPGGFCPQQFQFQAPQWGGAPWGAWGGPQQFSAPQWPGWSGQFSQGSSCSGSFAFPSYSGFQQIVPLPGSFGAGVNAGYGAPFSAPAAPQWSPGFNGSTFVLSPWGAPRGRFIGGREFDLRLRLGRR
jgi:hypothetical protein